MAIKLFVEPRKVYSWNEFIGVKPPFSIGLDGIIDSPTIRQPSGPYANFDHHSGVDRMATRTTSEQVALEINMGLFRTFSDRGIPTANIFVNDADEDTSLAVWLLQNHSLVERHGNPPINRLVFCEGMLDCTAGAYPFGDMGIRRKMAHIFQPYSEARYAGKLTDLDGPTMKNLIEKVGERITEYVSNGGTELELRGYYKKIGGGRSWIMVQETGPASRMAMFNDGIDAFVALVSEKDGKYVYSIGKRSVWCPFNLPLIYDALNSLEKDIVKDRNRWGGSDTIGGSPRETGSQLAPQKLETIINQILESK